MSANKLAGESEAGDQASAEELICHQTLTYRFLTISLNLIFLAYFRRRIENRQNLPKQGGVVLAINHQSFLDIPLVAMACNRHICFVARQSLEQSSFMKFILRQCGSVLVKRGSSDRRALRAMVEHLKRGDAIAVFPEGTRTVDGQVGNFTKGALHVAKIAKVPVLPVGIRGAYEALPRSRTFPFPKRVALRFGQAVDSAAPDAQERVEQAVRELAGDGSFHGVAPIESSRIQEK